MKTLVLYSSQDGQTEAIAKAIAKHIEGLGGKCDVIALDADLQWDVAQYHSVLIGASIRYGHFSKALLHFTQRYADQLNTMPSAFFSVNLTARKPDKCTPETNVYTRKFLLVTPWKPTLSAVFAGALRYPRYNWLDRMMIRFIMRLTGGETDTTKEVEYTDWTKVAQFAQQCSQIICTKVEK